MKALCEDDVILEVTGVPAAELLARIAKLRAHGVNDTSAAAGKASDRMRWRLVDFGDGTNEQFVRNAHTVLLGRGVTDPELQRRLRDLSAGSTRLEIVVRLALCPEGRSFYAKPVRGLAMPALVAAGRVAERAAQRPHVGEVGLRLRPAAGLVAGRSPRARLVRRAGRAGLFTAGIFIASRRGDRLRQQVTTARAELHALRGEEAR